MLSIEWMNLWTSPKIQDDDDDDESDDDGPHDESSGRKREGSSRLDKKFSAAATVAVMAGNIIIYTGIFLVSEQGGARARYPN